MAIQPEPPFTSTFRVFPGVGPVLERRLWGAGFQTWEDIERPGVELPPWGLRAATVQDGIRRARGELASERVDFVHRLQNGDLWRTYPTFRTRCAYLDIETTGLTNPPDYTTLIGLYDGEHLRIFERGKDLDQFPEAIKQYPFIVSFYGRGFDVPFLKREFPKIEFSQVHWDLCPAFRKLGVTGGLKAVEVEMGLARPSALTGISGFDAPSLWHKFKKGDHDALQVLKAYLAEDLLGLRPLAERAFNQFASKFPIPVAPLAETSRPPNPIAYNPAAVHWLLPHLVEPRPAIAQIEALDGSVEFGQM